MDGLQLECRPEADIVPRDGPVAPRTVARPDPIVRPDPVASQDAPSRQAADARANLALALTLAFISLATKAVLLPPAYTAPAGFVRWLARLALVASPDLCFAFGLALLWAGLHRLVQGRLGGRRGRWVFLSARLASYWVCGLYAVASVPMFKVLLAPFTVRLISLAGGPGMMTSSVLNHLSPALAAACMAAIGSLAAAPYLASLGGFRRLANPPRWAVPAACLAMVVYGAVSYLYIQSHWSDVKRWERRLAQNPHAILLASCLSELIKEEPFSQPFHFEAIDQRDFNKPRTARLTIAGHAVPDAERPRNVLLIVLESTAAEYLSLYGSPHATTPRLARRAADSGIVYENFYAQAPASWKSLVGLLASSYCRPDWRFIVGDCPDFDVPLLPQVLARHGWRNCFLHAGYWDWRGGQQFLKRRGVQTLLDARHLDSPPLNSWGTSDRAMFHRALAWIDANRQAPFLVCACTIETHHPYWPGERPRDFGVDDEELNRYLNALANTDKNIDWMLDQLQERGLLESTLIAVTADHGESFGQHDERVHGYGIYEPSVHVPLLLLHPSLRRLPRRDTVVRQQIDLPATILAVLGIDAPGDWQGQDMLSPAPQRPAYFYAVADQVVLGIRDGKLKYHYYVDTGREELFDLAADPAELVNLAARRPALLDQYRRRVGGFVHYQREFLSRHGGQRVVAAASSAGRR